MTGSGVGIATSNSAVRLLLPCTLAALLAQSPTAKPATREDGFLAFAVGEYGKAARILEPLADDPQRPDPVAAFLMATLYDSGRGVERNNMRACGLFLKAAATQGPFEEQAVSLSRAMREELGRATEFCSANARWQPLPQANFTLGPDHTVSFGPGAIVVRYHGQEGQMRMGSLPDSITLPPIYTPVEVTRPQRARRHFIQSFTWWRTVGSDWKLGWLLIEVVGSEVGTVTGDPNLLTSATAQPPETVDFTALVQLRITADGEAEWAIVGGTNPRSQVIPWRDPR